MPGPYQTQVGGLPGVGVAGDFCDVNPRSTLDAGPGGLVAGALGVIVGRFAWTSFQGIDPDNAPTVVNNYGAGVPSGFVHREQQALITTYLADASMVVPQGFGVTLFVSGGFWAKNDGTTVAAIGNKAYANLATGQVSFAPAATPGSASITASIAAVSATITGSVLGNVLTVTGSGANAIAIGAFISGTVGGSGVSAGAQVVAQLSGSVGAVGTYALNIGEQQVGPGSLTVSYGLMTVSAVGSGTIGVGGALGGTGVSAGTVLTALGSGTGGTGTYVVNNTQTMSSSAVTVGNTVETAFYATSGGQPGELVKMSRLYNAS